MKKITSFLIVLVFASMTTMFAQEENYTNEPGFVDFGTLSLFNEDDLVTEILIEEKLLRMVAKFTDDEEEPELTNLLGGLKLIKVNTFEVNSDNTMQILEKIKSIDKDLRGKKWDRIVKTKSKNEATNVYVKTAGEDDFVGLTIVTMDGGNEATFVNIVGSIDLGTINKLGDKFDIPGLDDIKKEKK